MALPNMKPAWLPDEIWQQKEWWNGIPWGRQVVESEECASLWRLVVDSAARVPVDSALREILCTVAYAREADVQKHSATRAERKKRAAKIENGVRKIEQELCAMADEPGELPLEIALQLSWVDGMPGPNYSPVDVRFRELLIRFSAATKAWANSPPQLSHATSEDARRLLLVRKLVRCFVKLYGKPLQAQVIAIVEIFYPDSNFDRDTVKNIAPTKDAFRF